MVSRWSSECSSVRLSYDSPSVVRPSVTSVVSPSICIFVSRRININWTFTKLAMCIDIADAWFEIANVNISSIFDRVVCTPHKHGWLLSFHVFIVSFQEIEKDIQKYLPPKSDVSPKEEQEEQKSEEQIQ